MKFLIYFVHRHLNFRFPELDSILLLQGLNPSDCYDTETKQRVYYADEDHSESPLFEINLPSEEHAKFLSNRGILIKAVYEIWGQGKVYDQVIESVRETVKEFPTREGYFSKEKSWSLQVDCFGRKIPMQEQEEKRNLFKHVLPLKGPVVMKNPDNTFVIMEDIGVVYTSEQTKSMDNTAKGCQPPTVPKKIFVLREVAGRAKNRGRGGARDLIEHQTLKRREYLGPTSMESEMALIMANMGLVTNSSIVLDPFVGTGSVLVPCATFGAFCFGMDIDSRVLYGKDKHGNPKKKIKYSKRRKLPEKDTSVTDKCSADKDSEEDSVNIFSNFKQYNLPYPELIRADTSSPPFAQEHGMLYGHFDAVICDPPYGIRAGARKSGCRPSKIKPSTFDAASKNYARHIPQTQPYAAEDVIHDLLEFSAKVLRVGGRLVYLLPTATPELNGDSTEQELKGLVPRHGQLELVASSEQPLTQKYGRRLITMRKTENTLQSDGERDASEVLANSFSNLREKIIEKNKEMGRKQKRVAIN